jgi:hypothetical protein
MKTKLLNFIRYIHYEKNLRGEGTLTDMTLRE